MPSRGAVSVCSIFIASSTINGVAARHRLRRRLMRTSFTRPGIGAMTWSPAAPSSACSSSRSGSVNTWAAPSTNTVTDWRCGRLPHRIHGRRRTIAVRRRHAIRPPVRRLAVHRRSENGAVSSCKDAPFDALCRHDRACEIFGARPVPEPGENRPRIVVAGRFRASPRPASAATAIASGEGGAPQSAPRCRARSARYRPRRGQSPRGGQGAPRNARLVTVPATRQRPRAPARRSSAALRSGPWAMTLAIIGS